MSPLISPMNPPVAGNGLRLDHGGGQSGVKMVAVFDVEKTHRDFDWVGHGFTWFTWFTWFLYGFCMVSYGFICF